MTVSAPNPGDPPRLPPPVREAPAAAGAVDNPAGPAHFALSVTAISRSS